ncbi:response regulator [Marinimicrobium alkaliphilum]|uniref:response regulator n=1 Tax=Marinimicrobium alkaliphilum TaxID=2202654 RepID=UPI000DB9DFF3|nr:response regulator [Marinimicrobium alkaliphilum]
MTDQHGKLLIIDDDTPVRQSILTYLEDSGFDVIEAGDGPSGLKLFGEHSPDLVITDLRMPGMDGLSVIQKIQQQSPDTPVIVVSGAGVMGDVVDALRLGASDYLIKPIVDMEMLVHSVHKAVERRDLLRENRRYREQLETTNRELVENLRLLERDQMAGLQVQRRLLPKPLATPGGYSANHHIAPSLYLSGDFIDYAYIQRRYLAFYLADVSGHGASSAFVTIWLKHTVTRMVREEGLFGDEASFRDGANIMLQDINRELNETRLNHHMSLFVGVIDTHTGVLRYAVAGQLPMPILCVNGEAEYLEGQGKPAGIFKDAQWQVYERQLPEAFSLTCFSDGILELLKPPSLDEKEALLLTLMAKYGGSLKSIRAKLGVKDQTDTPDDIAIMTIARGQ